MADESAAGSPAFDWRRETAVAAGALLVGLVLLPLAIWFVGEALIGPYEGGDGALALAEQFWLDLLALQPAAWLLALSPYALVLFLRLGWRALRAPAPAA
jgi:hypothetical protein